LKNDHQWQDARAAYEHFLETYPASTKLDAAKDDLGEINMAIYFSGGPSPDKDAYVIKPGDTLARIEKKLKAPGDVIMRSNGITDPRRLRVGDTLYVSHPDFSIVIDRKTQIVTLYNHARFFKQYHPTAGPRRPQGQPAAGRGQGDGGRLLQERACGSPSAAGITTRAATGCRSPRPATPSTPTRRRGARKGGRASP
jgi:LysM repeat protein